MSASSIGCSPRQDGTAVKWAKLLPVHDSSMHELSQEVTTLGSSEDCSIIVRDERVSSSHCMLIKDPDNVVWLYDCSETGTRCNNGKWLNQDCVTLHTGDYFHLVWDEVDASRRVGFCVLFADDCKSIDSVGEHDKAITSLESQPSTSSSSNLLKPSASKLSAEDEDLEKCLTCVICGDIYFECCSVQPCLHSFCTLCWLKWQKSECPMCRKAVSAYAKNHQLNDLVEVFLRKYPEKSKPDVEQNEIKQEITRLTPTPNQIRRCRRRYSGNYRYDRTLPFTAGIAPPQQASCVICSWIPGLCNPTAGNNQCSFHSFCACCGRPIPYQQTLHPDVVNTTECEICRRSFCSLINPNRCSACDGYCLSRVRDLTRYQVLPRGLLLNNCIETAYLNDYLVSQGIPIPLFIQQCLVNISTTVIYPFCTLSENSIVCTSCGENILRKLAYNYRISLPASQILSEAISRPDCRYGHYCRTQRNNIEHARRYNHICEPTF
ncbi:unnamed protein product [Heterobilharzia americana]|nr:unnamed protein product [Heterobilharzia americana]